MDFLSTLIAILATFPYITFYSFYNYEKSDAAGNQIN